jgi:hypothetical protein
MTDVGLTAAYSTSQPEPATQASAYVIEGIDLLSYQKRCTSSQFD